MAVFTLCMGQMLNNLVSQAGQMELHGVPNDMIQALSGIAVVLLGPAIQGVMSLLAKRRILLGPIVRMAISFIFTAAGMAFAGGVQQLIYSVPPCYNAPLACAESMGGTIPNNINVWMQTPIHFILASGEILGYVAMDEVSYTNSPQGLKSVVQAFKQLSNCLGSILGLALSPVSRDPYLVVLYSSLAGVMVLITGIFVSEILRLLEIASSNLIPYSGITLESTIVLREPKNHHWIRRRRARRKNERALSLDTNWLARTTLTIHASTSTCEQRLRESRMQIIATN